MNTRTNEWMHEVFDIWNGGLASVSCICAYFADAIFQKCSEQFIFFQHFQGDIGLLLESRAHFTDPHLLQVLRPQQFFTIFMWNRGLATVSCAFCRPLSRIEPRTRGNRDFLRRPRQPLYPKKCRVSRPRVFSNLNSRVPDFPHIPTTTCMMMWLPWWLRWWCGCHHGEKASHDNRS